jgi:hypothetical protein
MKQDNSFRKNIWFPADFVETFEKLEKISKLDQEIANVANNSQKQVGLTNLAIRKAIGLYVQLNEHLLIPDKQ